MNYYYYKDKAQENTHFQNKPSLCKGKILPALTRYISRISFPSPSYSKNSNVFTLAGEILGIISEYDEARREETA